MATGSAQFRTAAEWGSTNAFTFSTTNSSLNSYVTSTSQIPTKATLKGALKTGYTMTITNDSTYLSNQLVPNSAITVTQAATDPILDVRNCYFATGNGTLALSATTLYNYAGASMRNANFGEIVTQPLVEYLSPAGTVKIKNLSSYTAGEYWLQLGYYCGSTNTNQLIRFWFKIRIGTNTIGLSSTECYVDLRSNITGGMVRVTIQNNSGTYPSSGYFQICPVSYSYTAANYSFSSTSVEEIDNIPVLSTSYLRNGTNRGMQILTNGYYSGSEMAFLYANETSSHCLIPYAASGSWQNFFNSYGRGDLSMWKLII
jgi:hypothetical protein